MPLPMLILGLIGFAAFWLFWLCVAAVWLVFALVTWLIWPLTLLLVGSLLWRRRPGRAREQLAGEAAHAKPSFRSSGNAAFDEYRAEALRRLEEERARFGEFLDRLRRQRDRQEFDQYMADRVAHRTRSVDGAPRLIT